MGDSVCDSGAQVAEPLSALEKWSCRKRNHAAISDMNSLHAPTALVVGRVRLPLAMRIASGGLTGKLVIALLALLAISACAPVQPGENQASDATIRLYRQDAGTEVLLVGVHAIDGRHAWVAGTEGTYAWTADAGQSWTIGSVPGADSLQFRDVHARDIDNVFLLSIGPGQASRIYQTSDRGVTWTSRFVAEREEEFFDCFAFWDGSEGIAFSDAVNGRFPMIRSVDHGAAWQYLDGTPQARPNEGAFAASGSCVEVVGDSTVLVGTGNSDIPRLLRSDDRGRTWEVTDVPIRGGEATGITTIAFRDEHHGVALGGNVTDAAAQTDIVAVTSDGGRTWTRRESPPFSGAVYGSAYSSDGSILVVVGPGGSAYSTDEARSWRMLDSLSHWSVDLSFESSGWMVGPGGRITRISYRKP